MHDWKSLSHVRWECTYHVVIVPKYRKKVFFGKARGRIGEILKDLCKQRGIELIEGHAMLDQIDTWLSVSQKCSVSHTVDSQRGRDY